MKPIKLKLTGFYGISSGLGKQSVEVDLTGLEGKQLIAICGPNGAGKSTIMDNLHPYRVMPSRCAKPTPSAFSYYDNMASDAISACKELVWSHLGVVYRSVVDITRSGKTKKQEAFLFKQIENGDFVAYVQANGIASDGKTETYDLGVEEILGKPEVFFAYIFSAQGKAALSTLTNADVKNLLASMLGVENVKALGAKASDVCKALKPYLDDIKNANAPNLAIASKQPTVVASLVEKRAALAENGQEFVLAKSAVSTSTEALGKAKAGLEQLNIQASRRDALKMELTSSAQARDKAAETVRSQHALLRASSEVQLTDLSRSISSGRASLEQVKAQKLSANALIAQKDTCQNARDRLIVIRNVLPQKNCKVEELTDAILPLTELRESLQAAQIAVTNHKNEGVRLAGLVTNAKTVSSLANDVPCIGTDFHSACPLLTEANTARLEIDGNEVKLVTIRTEFASERRKAANLTQQIELLLDSERQLVIARREVQALQTEQVELSEKAAKLQQIEQAEASLKLLREQEVRFVAELADLHGRQIEVKDQLSVAKQKEDQQVQATYDASNADVLRIQAILETMPEVNSSGVDAAARLVSQAEIWLETLLEEKDTLSTQIFNLEKELVTIESAKKAVSVSSDQATSLATEMSYWNLLSTAFSNDGIVALSIDDAGPSISRIANQLLEECYGGRFQLRMATQKATATGILKEDFEIYVNDVERGEEKQLVMMSGGERVWVNECLVRAFALYKTQVSGCNYATLFSDESDGPLDPERKRQFMAMKRAVLKAGGYECEFFITQTPELWALADHIIDVRQL